MAGSIPKKLRGENAKNRTKLEILLYWLGPRVDSQKVQGLFSKKSRPKGYAQISAVGSRSSGSDLKGARSNLARWI
jgi:hypothetical protein